MLAPFANRHAAEIAASWTPSRFGTRSATEFAEYLEGSIRVEARRAPAFALGFEAPELTFGDVLVGRR